MQDQEILELYETRNENAIRETQRKYGSIFMRIAMHVLGIKEDAEECVSESMFKLWNAIPPAKPAIFEAFAVTVVRRTALTEFQRQRRAMRGGGEMTVAADELSEVLRAPDDVEAQADAGVVQEAIRTFLDGLKPEQRRIFMQRYWYFLSVAEIAEEMGISESKVKVTLMRTRNKLKDYLEQEDLL